jgi:multiple sugar transport system permease protein
VPAQWSLNQLAYELAFGVGNFGASAAISLVMLLIGVIGAVVVLRATTIFRTDLAGEH